MSQARGKLDKGSPTLGQATPPAPLRPGTFPTGALSSHIGEGRGHRASDSGLKTALGLHELKGSLQGGRGKGAPRLLGHQTALAKLLDELSANEFETDNEVPFRDTWAEKKKKNEGKSARGEAHLEIFFFSP